MRRTLPLAFALAAVAAAPASAAYAPRLEAKLDPATPATAPALTLTLRQAAGEDAHRTEVIRYPPAFRFNPAFAVQGCPADREAASDCPDTSRIGEVSVESELGPFSGPLYLTDDFRFVIFLHGFGGLVQQKVEGYVRVGSDGYVETVLSDLPAVRTTLAEVRLLPGDRSVLLTPAKCGTYTLQGRFTSQNGETVASDAPVAIAGCQAPAAVTSLRARVRAGRIAVSWVLASAGQSTTIDLARRTAAKPWVRWRHVRTMTASAASGPNRATLARRNGRGLAPGRYRITLTSRGADGKPVDSRRTEVTVR